MGQRRRSLAAARIVVSVVAGLAIACGQSPPFAPDPLPAGSAAPQAVVSADSAAQDPQSAASRGSGPLTYLRYLAFGDSITQGYPSRRKSYPSRLEDLLEREYRSQRRDIKVRNGGVGGETAARGRRRLPGALLVHRPEVLLLLEGYNGVRSVSPDTVAGDLRAMVRYAQDRGVLVLLATLTPIPPKKEAQAPGTRAAVAAVNERIRIIAAQEDVTLVDLYQALDGQWHLFSRRDVHPNSDGYKRIAQIFFGRIQRLFGTAGRALTSSDDPGGGSSLEEAAPMLPHPLLSTPRADARAPRRR